MTYRLLHTGAVEHTDDDGTVTTIPPDERNADFQLFLAWQADQPAPLQPEPEPEPDPAAVNRETVRAQAEAYLDNPGPTDDDVRAQVEALTRLLTGRVEQTS